MAYTTIDKPSDYFNVSLWTGDNNARTISGVGFQTNWLWEKCRSNTYSHILIDSVRGKTKQIRSDTTALETTNAQGVTAFNSDGYVLGTQDEFANNDNTFVGWNWKESATAGFDIVSYTGNSSARTISHNCGAVPKMMIVKKRSDGDNWSVYHQATGAGNFTILNTTAASAGSSTMWNNTTPTSSVFSLGNKGEVNASSQTFIAYLFAEKKGYSKFGSYRGNNNANGTFVYLGFKPAFIMVKCSDAGESYRHWAMFDNKRSSFNGQLSQISANNNALENTGEPAKIDLVANGFKLRGTSGETNDGGQAFIYIAFAESPFVTSTGIPATAR